MSTIKFQTAGHWTDLLLKIQNNGTESIAAGKRYVFLYVCANWSLACQKMETDVFSNQLACDFLNANFVNIRVLVGIIPEADTRKKISDEFNITIDTYPLCLFLDQHGIPLHHATGILAPVDLINETKIALGIRITNLLGAVKP